MKLLEFVQRSIDELNEFHDYMRKHYPDLDDLDSGDWDEQLMVFIEMKAEGQLRK